MQQMSVGEALAEPPSSTGAGQDLSNSSYGETLLRSVSYLWGGPLTLPRKLRLEWRFVAIRWVGILIMAPTLSQLTLTEQQLSGGYIVLGVTAIYNLALQILLAKRSKYFLSGYLTTVCDGLLDIAMIVLANGFDSPFYYILYTVTVATAMRYSYGPVLAVALMFVGADITESIVLSRALGPAFIFRSAFLILTAVMAGYLHEQAQEAEDALEERLNQANALNKELESFSYSVSHDLRAPLRSIDGFSQALLEDYGEKLDGEAQEYLGRVRGASQKMAELIDDLLDLSRVTRSEMHRQTVSMTGIVTEILRSLAREEPERRVQTRVGRHVLAHGDPHLLEVVLENLLSNAWKFTRNKKPARIYFGSRRINGDLTYFVKDNGVGFDMTYAHKLFGAFQRLHAEAEFEGNGIGLATVQRIVHRHGGRAWAEGSNGEGATFYFTL